MSLRLAKNRVVTPDARVIIEVQPARYAVQGGAYVKTKPAELLEVTNFTSIQTTCDVVNGKSSGSITLVNSRDSAYNLARQRSKDTRRQREVADYLTEVMRIAAVNEINPRRRALQPGQKRLFGIPVERLGRTGQRILYVLESENGVRSQGRVPTNRIDEYAAYEWFVADWQIMRRVWIDYRDRHGRWVAGLTGLISSLQDSMVAGEPPLLNVGLSGMSRFFELTEFITQQALENKEWPFETGLEQFPISYESNSLARLTPEEIVTKMVESVNRTFTLTGGSYDPARRPEDYFHTEPLIRTDDPIGYGDGDQAIDPERDWTPEQNTEGLIGKLIIDPQAVRGDARRVQVYREAIRSAFNFYSYENTTAMGVCKEVAKLTNFDWFDDPKGNVVLWVPKYDDLPRLTPGGLPASDRVVQSALAGAGFVSPFIGLENSLKGLTTKFGESYSTLPFHDDLYILDDWSLRSWNLVESEDPIKTFARVSSQPNLINPPAQLLAESNTGYTSWAALSKLSEPMARYVQGLARRFGTRRHTFPTMFSDSIGGEKDILTRFAYCQLVRSNAFGSAATIALHHRPELWPGRNMFLVERQKLAYLLRIQNQYGPKTPFMTTITAAYVHDPAVLIGQPWWAATESQAPPSEAGRVLGV